MKKYVTPVAEKIEFNYKDQVAAASSGRHEGTQWAEFEGGPCVDYDENTGFTGTI